MNKKLILTRGIQGSGKTTWARQWVEEDPEFVLTTMIFVIC